MYAVATIAIPTNATQRAIVFNWFVLKGAVIADMVSNAQLNTALAPIKDKASQIAGTVINGGTYNDMGSIRSITHRQFSSTAGAVYFRLVEETPYSAYHFRINGRYIRTITDYTFTQDGAAGVALTKREGSFTTTAQYTTVALNNTGGYIWLRLGSVVDPQLNNLVIMIESVNVGRQAVLVTSAAPSGGTWVGL
jgi:hypothetical protein